MGVNGRVIRYLGKLLRRSGLLARHTDCCCGEEEAAPCECPEEGLASCYQIADYTDGDIGACDECAADAGAAWDGQLEGDESSCYWSDGGTHGTSIDGKALYDANLWLIPGGESAPEDPCGLGEEACYWYLIIECAAEGAVAHTVWEGYKATGLTPAGTYTRCGGCDETSTIEIEECPT